MGHPLRLGDEGNPSLQPGRTAPEQTSPLVALQTDILPNLCRQGLCLATVSGVGQMVAFQLVGTVTMGRADKATLISYSPGVVASPPFPSALRVFHLHGKGGQCQREKAPEVQVVGWGGGSGRDVAQASLHLILCTRGFLLCKAVKGMHGTCPNVQPLLLSESHSRRSTDKQEKAH